MGGHCEEESKMERALKYRDKLVVLHHQNHLQCPALFQNPKSLALWGPSFPYMLSSSICEAHLCQLQEQSNPRQINLVTQSSAKVLCSQTWAQEGMKNAPTTPILHPWRAKTKGQPLTSWIRPTECRQGLGIANEPRKETHFPSSCQYACVIEPVYLCLPLPRM